MSSRHTLTASALYVDPVPFLYYTKTNTQKPVPQGTKVNELEALARRQSTYFKYGTNGPAETAFAKIVWKGRIFLRLLQAHLLPLLGALLPPRRLWLLWLFRWVPLTLRSPCEESPP